ncbi:hypothetical protein NIES37_10690 [Tolypothrix tenuis PCC 7101]|uniref:Uncharacterized protein n=1 Tax=Tolypothrix tenuis PCC 7101 TaxID=231146 RepID=A0A1Z4MUH0_9CYAN|nr:hypothetical protein [Aulosira sp. FACHB-113]BAY97132.1 hypothetical protein NIES37_10690 [Tolypothrix tenuis PCC 7101]BAZ72360.1 hypothetical protein NIES50_09140 [Aulosira laxa NIES-50]
MSMIDALLLTLVSTVICLSFPKLLSIILAPKTKEAQPSVVPLEVPEPITEVPSFSS